MSRSLGVFKGLLSQGKRTAFGMSACALMLGALGSWSVRSASAQCSTYNLFPGPAAYIAGDTDIGNHGDEPVTDVALPFPVSIYGNSYSTVSCSSNGFAEFGDSFQEYVHVCMSSNEFSVPVIFALWSDMETDGAGQGIFTATTGTAPDRTFTIEWRCGYYGNTSPDLDFEIQFHEGQDYFDIYYKSLTDGGSSASSGVQDSAGSFTSIQCNGSPTLANDSSYRLTCGELTYSACCQLDGSCVLATPGTCDGTLFPDVTSCEPTPCSPGEPYACCKLDGSCILTTTTCSGTPQPGVTSCTPSPCGPIGACCMNDGTCQIVHQGACPTTSPTRRNKFVEGGTCSPDFCVTPNDDCSGAIVVDPNSLPYPNTVDNSIVHPDDGGGYTASQGYMLPDGVWYTFTAPSTGRLTYISQVPGLDDTGIVWPNTIFLFEPNCDDAFSSLNPFDGYTSEYNLDCDFGPYTPRGSYGLVAGQSVTMMASDPPSELGIFFHYSRERRVTFNFVPAVVPVNDTCATATDISSVSFPHSETADNLGATDDVTSCGTGPYHGVWYTYTSSASGPQVLQCAETGLQGASWAVSRGAACATPTCQSGETIQVVVHAGETVKLLVGSASDPIAQPDLLRLTFSILPCPADMDGSGTVNVSDIFAFLRAWFSHDASADFNHDTLINVSDIFAFLRSWFGGC